MRNLSAFLNRRTGHFLTIYETGNIHEAADEIGLTQPAVTMSLRQLEGDLGTKLFERTTKGVTPTEAGRIYYRHACTLRQSALYAAQEIEKSVSGRSGTLRIGAGVAWATTVIPGVLIDIEKKFPDLSINLVTGVGDQLATLFETGKLDVYLAAGPMAPESSPDYSCTFLTNIPMIAVAGPWHPLARKKSVTLEELVATKWAGFYEDDTFLNLAGHYMALHGLPAPMMSMRTNSVVALTEFVKGTKSVTLVSSPLLEKVTEAGLVPLQLTTPLWDIPVSIYARAGAKSVEPIHFFTEHLQKSVQNVHSSAGCRHVDVYGPRLFATP